MDVIPSALLTALNKDFEQFFRGQMDDVRGPFEILKDPQLVAASLLLKNLVKKWEPETPSEKTRSTAIATFTECNNTCAVWHPVDHPLYSRVYSVMREIAYTEMGTLDWERIFLKGGCGPGASIGSHGRNSSLEKLFLNTLVATSPSLVSVYLEEVPKCNLSRLAEAVRQQRLGRGAFRIVAGSNLDTVAKNDETDRVICTEASLNMYLQLGLGGCFDEVLRTYYGYDAAVQQERNRALAELGSKNEEISTIDSTSASDLVSCSATAGVFHPEWVAACDDLRSPVTTIDGVVTPLYMVSSMGNGFTFPMQTYWFSLVIKALTQVLEVEWSRYNAEGTKFGVFGDDIIVPTALYEPLCGMLTWLGGKPNLNKSYSRGKFRESCGGDFYDGTNVRAVYCKRLRNKSDMCSLINRLNIWSARHLVPLRRTIRYLQFKGWTGHLVPTDEDMSSGIFAPNGVVPKGHNYAYKAFVRCGKSDSVYHQRTGALQRRFDNPFGVLLSTINGSVRGGCISRRLSEAHFVEEVRTCPFWARPYDIHGYGVAYSNWEIMAQMNLYG